MWRKPNDTGHASTQKPDHQKQDRDCEQAATDLEYTIGEPTRQENVGHPAVRRAEGFCVNGEGASPSVGQKEDPFGQEQGQCDPREYGDPVKNDLIEKERQNPGQDHKDRCVYGLGSYGDLGEIVWIG